MPELTRKTLRLVICAVLGSALVVGCSSKDSADDPEDTTNTDLAAAAAQVGDAARGTTSVRDVMDAPRVTTDSCSTHALGACASETRTRNFSTSPDGGDQNPCTRGKGNGLNVFGSAVLTFTGTASCAISAAGDTVTRTLKNHYFVHGNKGKTVIVYTGTGTVGGKAIADADLKDYQGTTRSGGAKLTKGNAGTDTLDILGIHRRKVNPNGKYAFWHTVYTAAGAGLSVQKDTPAVGKTTVSGTAYIALNRAAKTVTKTLTGVVYDASCRHPIAGTTTFSTPGEGGAAATTVTVEWQSECGKAKDKSAGDALLDLEDDAA